ncbi:MAG: restriction endonuclease subunit R [Alphaproteobacteria bacterium]|nr:restriction endonuclease subunit R [Alphaproteobacteria bacterium]
MQLREYQERALDTFAGFLRLVADRRANDAARRAALAGAGLAADDLPDPVIQAWNEARKQGLAAVPTDWHMIQAGAGGTVPHICFRVPTGGGKTLMAAHAVERYFVDHEKRRAGLVLWITPSDAIFNQTWRQLRDREHPYRQVLDRASGGRVRLLKKLERLTPLDLSSQLCVLVMMLQSANVEAKETRKIFQDSGDYTSFFPSDDPLTTKRLLDSVPNLETHDLASLGGPMTGPQIKTSLGNVLRIAQPMIVMDEGHRAYSDLARKTLASLNPRFMLELSATPKAERSNILVSVSGRALKDENMIKLPINLNALRNADWKATLSKAWEKTEQLNEAAEKLRGNTGRYIRPIMLIRVERTGRDQQDGLHVHAEDVRKRLIEKMGVPPEAIRVQTATVKELEGEDLLSEYSPVRVIVTKDALREGWDCPFAYVLAILSSTTAATALTQMIGRILRQPQAQATGIEELDTAWVYCFDQEVSAAVDNVRKGLQSEGLDDIADQVRTGARAEGDGLRREIVERRKPFKGKEILLPKVRYREGKGWRDLDYERDILAHVAWDKLAYSRAKSVTLDGLQKAMIAHAYVDIEAGLAGDRIAGEIEDTEALEDRPLDRPFLVRQLLDVVPNPWQGMRILDEALQTIRGRGLPEVQIVRTRLALVNDIKRDLQDQVDAAAEAHFRDRVNAGDISFQLVGATPPADDWKVPAKITVTTTSRSKKLTRANGTPAQLSLFDPVYEDSLNKFEKDVALYLDEKDAVHWWHRIAARADWGLQGWLRNKVYPDFLCWFVLKDGVARLMALETKGKQYQGSPDTEWKKSLFKVLEDLYAKGVDRGEVQLVDPQAREMRFRILLSSEAHPQAWQTDLAALFAAA